MVDRVIVVLYAIIIATTAATVWYSAMARRRRYSSQTWGTLAGNVAAFTLAVAALVAYLADAWCVATALIVCSAVAGVATTVVVAVHGARLRRELRREIDADFAAWAAGRPSRNGDDAG